MDYIVTGGAGYIGGYLVDKLVDIGKVTALDDLSKGTYINNKTNFIKIDLRDATKANELKLPDQAIIFHLAANPDVRGSMTNIYEHYSRDVTTTLNVMELARKLDAKKVLFASSSVVYGEAKKLPTPETYTLGPISNYGLFKLQSEEILKYYSRNYGIKTVSLRIANIIGGRMSHGIIPDFRNKLIENSSELVILGDGKQRKSYLYITDAVDAFNHIAHLKSSKKYNVFNIGNVDYTSVDEIATTIEQEMGLNPKRTYINKLNGRGWEGDVKLMLLDIKKIQKLGWKPKHSSSEAVRLAVKDLISISMQAN